MQGFHVGLMSFPYALVNRTCATCVFDGWFFSWVYLKRSYGWEERTDRTMCI